MILLSNNLELIDLLRALEQGQVLELGDPIVERILKKKNSRHLFTKEKIILALYHLFLQLLFLGHHSLFLIHHSHL